MGSKLTQRKRNIQIVCALKKHFQGGRTPGVGHRTGRGGRWPLWRRWRWAGPQQGGGTRAMRRGLSASLPHNPSFPVSGMGRTQLPHRSSTAGFLWTWGNAERNVVCQLRCSPLPETDADSCLGWLGLATGSWLCGSPGFPLTEMRKAVEFDLICTLSW